MPKSARGQITIVDLNDGKTLSAYLRPSKATSQIYNTDDKSFNPSWTTSDSMRIYPELYVSGNAGNMVGTTAITSISWTVNGTAVASLDSKYGASTYTSTSRATDNYLQFNKDMVVAQYRIECTMTYFDSTTGQSITAKSTLTIQRNDTTGSAIRLLLSTPNGMTFHRDPTDASGGITSLTIKAELWRGSSVDTTDVEYEWYKDGTLIASNPGTITGYATSELTVKADDIDNVSIFRCEVTDKDSQSTTYNKTLADAVTLYDMTDPFEVEIQSTTGDTLTSSATSTTLNAVIKQNGEVIPTTNSIYSNAKFVWKMYNKDGALVKYYKSDQAGGSTKWVSVPSTGIPSNVPSVKDNIVVSKSDITYRCTIICEVTNI